MSFTKKTWAVADIISAVELNRIEQGVEDIYNQAVTMLGIKSFQRDVILSQSDIAGKALYCSTLGVAQSSLGATTTRGILFKEYLGGGFRFEDSVGALNSIQCGIINGVTPESHRSRHRSADNLAIAADIVVDAAGNGDYTTVSAAIAVVTAGQCIFIKTGDYTENAAITIPANVHLTGCIDSILTMVGANSNIVMLESSIVSNFRLKSTTHTSMTEGLIYSDTHYCMISNMYIEASTYGILYKKGFMRIVNNYIESVYTGIYCDSAASYQAIIDSNYIYITGTNNAAGGITGQYSYCIITNNIVVGAYNTVGFGIGHIGGTNYNMISGNHIETRNRGIVFGTLCDGVLVHGNTVYNCVTPFIFTGTNIINAENISG
jgi:hypothetical protein